MFGYRTALGDSWGGEFLVADLNAFADASSDIGAPAGILATHCRTEPSVLAAESTESYSPTQS